MPDTEAFALSIWDNLICSLVYQIWLLWIFVYIVFKTKFYTERFVKRWDLFLRFLEDIIPLLDEPLGFYAIVDPVLRWFVAWVQWILRFTSCVLPFDLFVANMAAESYIYVLEHIYVTTNRNGMLQSRCGTHLPLLMPWMTLLAMAYAFLSLD